MMNEYHIQRSIEAVKEVLGMREEPLSLEQAKMQIARINQEYKILQSKVHKRKI